MSLSAYVATRVINFWLRGTDYSPPATIYLALFTVMPGRDGTGGTEVVGGSYTRQAITFGADTDGVTSNSNVMTFSGMPAATIVGGGIYDALTNGNLIDLAPMSTPRTVGAGGDLTVAVGDVVVVVR